MTNLNKATRQILKGCDIDLSTQTRRRGAVEWQIMRSILKHNGGADIYQILDDVKSYCCEKEQVFECLAVLMETEIISFSLLRHDFLFAPEVAFSPLVRALKKSKTPPITVSEYISHGWRKLAGLN